MDWGEYTSIALDTSGKVYIAYYGNYDIEYATNASGAWVTTIVDDEGGKYEFNSTGQLRQGTYQLLYKW